MGNLSSCKWFQTTTHQNHRHGLVKMYFILILFIFLLIGFYSINLENSSPTIVRDSDAVCDELMRTNRLTDRRFLVECINRARRGHGRALKSIQVLTQFYDWIYWKDEQLGERAFENCSQKACFAFRYESSSWNGRRMQEAVEESDGVIVHAPNLLTVPSRHDYKRDPRQLWSFFTIESQRYSFCLLHYSLADLDDWFNLTNTVKTNKHAYMPYDLKQLHRYEAYLTAFTSRQSFNYHQQPRVPQKRKLIMWFVSHCSTASRRELLVRELRKHVDVDIYGRCRFIDSKSDPCASFSSTNDRSRCLVDLFNSYKFYLSLENSNCDGYITEKYFQFYETPTIFDVDIVPVVRGAQLESYQAIAPEPHRSFVFVDAFASVKSLADYLVYLDRNDSAYREYLSWKPRLFDKMAAAVASSANNQSDPTEILKPVELAPLCELCEKLHDERFRNASHNPILRISEIFNPMKDCSLETSSEEKQIKRLRDVTSCFWAEYHLRFKYFWHIFDRIF